MKIKGGKHGCDVRYITAPIVLAHAHVAHVWHKRHPTFPLVLTSCGEGTHMDGSKHYKSEALDFRTKDPQGVWALTDDQRAALKLEVKSALGDEFDVTISQRYGNLHVELDPKKAMR